MIFVKPTYENTKVNAVMIPKVATDKMLTSDAIDRGKCFIIYRIAGCSIMTLQHDGTRFPAGSEIIFMMLPFVMFMTGDLSFYANMLGMPNSCSH
jgi:hypothetical protein